MGGWRPPGDPRGTARGAPGGGPAKEQSWGWHCPAPPPPNVLLPAETPGPVPGGRSVWAVFWGHGGVPAHGGGSPEPSLGGGSGGVRIGTPEWPWGNWGSVGTAPARLLPPGGGERHSWGGTGGGNLGLCEPGWDTKCQILLLVGARPPPRGWFCSPDRCCWSHRARPAPPGSALPAGRGVGAVCELGGALPPFPVPPALLPVPEAAPCEPRKEPGGPPTPPRSPKPSDVPGLSLAPGAGAGFWQPPDGAGGAGGGALSPSLPRGVPPSPVRPPRSDGRALFLSLSSSPRSSARSPRPRCPGCPRGAGPAPPVPPCGPRRGVSRLLCAPPAPPPSLAPSP